MKILVVDDDEIAQAVARKILENAHYEVVLGANGAEALEILRSGEIKIVISDWNMPVIDGIELCRILRANPRPGYTYIILVTERSSKQDVLEGLSAGADDFLSKPFDPAELLVRMRNAERVLEMERNLKQSEMRNGALLSAVPDSIFRIRHNGELIDYSAGATRLPNVEEGTLQGFTIDTIVPPAMVEEMRAAIERALRTGEIQTLEYTLRIDEASRVFEARIKDSGPQEVTAIIRDISDRARLDQMKSDFINRATHELRTPIATMLLMVNLLDNYITDREYREYWEVMKTELGRERILVEDLLSAGRLESNQARFHFRQLNLYSLLKLAIRQSEPGAREKNISISLLPQEVVDEAAFFIEADEGSMTQVFMNLLGNAIKFTPSGGSISAVLRRQENNVLISIKDTGMGIPGEDLPFLFNRFFRGTNAIHEEIPGTGIGLFIVRSILEKHEATIKVHTELGSGTQFDINIPDKPRG